MHSEHTLCSFRNIQGIWKVFSKDTPSHPTLWKFQLSFRYFFRFFSCTETPIPHPQEILILPVGGGVRIFSGTAHYKVMLSLLSASAYRFWMNCSISVQLISCDCDAQDFLKQWKRSTEIYNNSIYSQDWLPFIRTTSSKKRFLEYVMIFSAFIVFFFFVAAIFFSCSTRAKCSAKSYSWKHNCNYLRSVSLLFLILSFVHLSPWSSIPCSSLGQGHCVVFLSKTPPSHSAPLHPSV